MNVDISECYDSIDSQKLYDIMEQVLMTSAKSSVCISIVFVFKSWNFELAEYYRFPPLAKHALSMSYKHM